MPIHMTAPRAALGLLAFSVLAATAVAAAPDFSGFWKPVETVTALRTLDGKAPPLTAAAQRIYDQHLASAKAGDRSFDNETMCRPGGIPRMLTQSAFELVQTDTELAFLFDWNRLQRPVEIRAQHSQFDHAYPYYLGHPIASWQGSTLVIDSIYFNDDTVLDASGLPHSDRLHVVEHLSLKGPDQLDDVIRIEDSKSFTGPWQTRLSFTRMPVNTRFDEDICVERLGIKDLNTHKNHVPKS